jgi:hypothetical protein
MKETKNEAGMGQHRKGAREEEEYILEEVDD